MIARYCTDGAIAFGVSREQTHRQDRHGPEAVRLRLARSEHCYHFANATAGFPISVQLLVLGTVVNIMFSSADILCVVMAVRIQELMKGSSSANLWAQRIGGTILVGLGIKLVASHQ